MSDPFTPVDVGGHLVQAYFNLPAIIIMGLITIVLVMGIRESATTNAVLVFVKVAVVLFVIVLGDSIRQPRQLDEDPRRKPPPLRRHGLRRPASRHQTPNSGRAT